MIRLHHDLLRVMVPTPQYLLAMKCMAMRIDATDATSDLADIRSLMAATGLVAYEQIIEAVRMFYPAERISPRTEFGIRQIADKFARVGRKQASDDLPTPKKTKRSGAARKARQ